MLWGCPTVAIIVVISLGCGASPWQKMLGFSPEYTASQEHATVEPHGVLTSYRLSTGPLDARKLT